MEKKLLIEFRLLPNKRLTKREAEDWRHYWYNWDGVVPDMGDIVQLHFGDDNEREGRFMVQDRLISGTESKKIILYVNPMSDAEPLF